jgi:hypothetical protein
MKRTEFPAMKRTEVIEEAKQLVLSRGPAICLEFTTEIVIDHLKGTDATDYEETGKQWEDHPDFRPVYDETLKQARRVYAFLGYGAPW